MSDQRVLFGVTVPPEVKLTERQWFALNTIASKPQSSEQLGVELHRRRGCGYCKPGTPCQYAASEGAHMGGTLRQKGLVKFRRKGQRVGVWYLVEQGAPRSSAGPQPSADIGF